MSSGEIAVEVSRALDSLVGLSVGDALGQSFLLLGAAAEPLLARRAVRKERPWRWTDDTAMAISIVRHLNAYGTLDPDELAPAFADRYMAEPHRGYGGAARTVLTRIAAGAPWRREAARLFDGEGSMGNGAAMRAAPIGAYFAADLKRTCDQALRSAAPTHAHPDGAAGAVAVAVAAAVAADMAAHGALDGDALLAAVHEHTPAGPTRAGIASARSLGLAADPAEAARRLGSGAQVIAADTVPFCVWVAARHLDSYEEAVWTAITPPGDRDTTGAIVGGIVALSAGVDSIPAEWRRAREPLT
ncbi:MAG: ADP-ribosylglycohydrolase family protein [Deltaproteobacteria bacterium]|nr:ADP-ribosylglycohydrolase family protein [Deltaproteobacteria bacterium]